MLEAADLDLATPGYTREERLREVARMEAEQKIVTLLETGEHGNAGYPFSGLMLYG